MVQPTTKTKILLLHEERDWKPKTWPVRFREGEWWVTAPSRIMAESYAAGARRTLQRAADKMGQAIRFVWPDMSSEDAPCSITPKKPQLSLYGQDTLPFEPDQETLEQFILSQQQRDRIVTMLDISLPTPQFIRITPNQVWERNEGNGLMWNFAEWLKPETFGFIWQESMRPVSRRRIPEALTLWAMEERLDPEAGNTELQQYLYCCTAPGGEIRVYQSDVRLLLMPLGKRPGDRHLVRMMVSDRLEQNPRAWETLIPSAPSPI